SLVMKNLYSAAGLFVSCLLVLAMPRPAQERVATSNPVTLMQRGATTVLQLAQDDSNNPNADGSQYQQDDSDSNGAGDNPGQPNAQSGDDSGGSGSWGSGAGNDSPQMGGNPDDNAGQANDDPSDQPNSDDSGESR